MRRLLFVLMALQVMGGSASAQAAATGVALTYRVESRSSDSTALIERFSEPRIALLEKLNRADRNHLTRLDALVIPETWVDDERAYSPMPSWHGDAATTPRFLVVHVPGQVFGAYEYGRLVRWGPLSTGARASPTPPGLFHLNWRSRGHVSSVDPTWYLPWYFNFESREGRAFHQYALPGRPVSHGCIRLLERDARWLYDWGDGWTMDATGAVVQQGTPVLVVGTYAFDDAPPWRSLEWLASTIVLPNADR